MNKKISFSPPEILDEDIQQVISVLKSGWITTGPVTKQFEKKLSEYCSTKKTLCLNSATAGLFIALKLFDIGEGDEVITTPYSFAATSNVILHCGAKPVFADINKKDFNINPENIAKLINKKTKAIISVDYGGYPVDYDEIKKVLEKSKSNFVPKKDTLQEKFRKPLFISDSAHSLGAFYKNRKIGSQADFSVFSFHAVKNLTTAEGGAVVFNDIGDIPSDEIYRRLFILSLHGQNKDAMKKYREGSWQYDIEEIGYKFNMTDIQAALGLSQLKRYDNKIIPKRKEIEKAYKQFFLHNENIIFHNNDNKDKISSAHIFSIRIRDFGEKKRNLMIKELMDIGISTNVHYIPIPMFTIYKKLGYNISDYPECLSKYENQISCPIYSSLSIDDVHYIVENIGKLLDRF